MWVLGITDLNSSSSLLGFNRGNFLYLKIEHVVKYTSNES